MVVLDIYDDPAASILAKRLLETGIPLQEKLASSTLLSSDDLNRLPDHLFAFVGRDAEGSLLRKFAMHDAPHVMTSIVYFLERRNALPSEQHEKVAGRLVNACAWYDVEPPHDLVKIALAKQAREQVENPAAAWDPVEAAKKLKQTKSPDAKMADLRGTSMGSPGALSNDPRPPTPERKGLATKMSSEAQKVAAEAAPCHYALPAQQRYPLRDEAQVKRASRYFAEHFSAFTPADRRTFAQNVAARASELGVKVANLIVENSGTEYGPYIRAELEGRKLAFEGLAQQPTYAMLLEKQASVPPQVMLEMLQRVDHEAGVDRSYGRSTGFRDPYEAVYGGVKVAAAAPFEWTHEGHYVSEDALTTLSKKALDLDVSFGSGFTARYMQDPVGSFKSLSTVQKVVLCRLANEASRTP